jgi:hypothetical protein
MRFEKADPVILTIFRRILFLTAHFLRDLMPLKDGIFNNYIITHA